MITEYKEPTPESLFQKIDRKIKRLRAKADALEKLRKSMSSDICGSVACLIPSALWEE